MSPQQPQQNGAQPLTAQGGTPLTTPESSQPAVEAQQPPQTHTVVQGETLSEIASKWGASGQTADLWAENLGKEMEPGVIFGSYDHMQSGGNPSKGWVLAIPASWQEPQQPQPQAVVSDSDKMVAMMAQFKELAAKLGVTF